MKQCAVCGKSFDVLWEQLWVYKRGSKFMCSYHCLREYDVNNGKKVSDKQEDESMRKINRGELLEEMIHSGKTVNEFFAGNGYLNPGQAFMDCKIWARKNDPDLLARVKEYAEKQKPAARTKRKTNKKPEPIKFDYEKSKPIAKVIKVEENDGGVEITAVKIPKPEKKESYPGTLKQASVELSSVLYSNGRYIRDVDDNANMVLRAGTNYLTHTPEEWIDLTREIMQALKQLFPEKDFTGGGAHE